MASTFLRRNRLLDFPPSGAVAYRRKRRKSSLLRRIKLQKASTWLLGLLAASGLFLWDHKLLVATVSGLTMMGVIYAMQQPGWRQRWVPLYKLVTSFSTLYIKAPSRQFILAVGDGLLAILSTYLAVSIWSEASSPWIATGALLQGGGTLAVLLLLVGQLLQRRADRKDIIFSNYLADLSHEDPLRRLVAVKQLTRSLQRTQLDADDRAVIADCFRLMVGQEQESMVQDALFDGLQLCDRQLEPVPLQPLPPLPRKPSSKSER
ncbi:MAG: hypothetical protein NZ772_18760 [Cyanobacteria bacterium]|nr:hypothetical protein [Cyanobacteriota bacterium]MDW8203286.1 hypothetical protein [Cyanobacteriota bacterium SKYGB_h_bin112]